MQKSEVFFCFGGLRKKGWLYMIGSVGTMVVLFASVGGVCAQIPNMADLRPSIIGSLASSALASVSQTAAQNQSSQTEPMKASKHSAPPATGEFQDNQFVESAPDQDRRVLRESRHKDTLHEITDPADTSAP